MSTLQRLYVLLAELSVLGMAFATMASAFTTSYVAQAGQSPATPYATWTDAASNIQDAINVTTVAGSTVWVSNGTYQTGGVTNWPSGTLLTNRVAITNAITVRSANNDPTNTIIKGAWDPATNGPAAVRCVYVANNSWLIGFMLTNGATLASGAADDRYGGGVRGEGNLAKLSNCVIAGNSARNDGGGVFYGTLYNCTLSGNSAVEYGGGMHCDIGAMYNCMLTGNSAKYGGGVHAGIQSNCILTGNSAANQGGGANCGNMYNCTLTSNSGFYGGGASDSTLYNCTLIGNQGYYGGGAIRGTLYNCILSGNSATSHGGGMHDGTLYNCTLTGNSANYGGGVRGGDGGTLYNCIVQFNSASTSGANWYELVSFTNCCTTPTNAVWAAGNITNDPMFVANGSGYGTNHVAGNYRLSNNSPCINAGTNQSWMTTTYPYDRDGRTRIRYGIVDMGAYERINAGTVYTVH